MPTVDQFASRLRRKIVRSVRPTPTLKASDPEHSAYLARRIWDGEYDRRGFVPRRGWVTIDIGANVGAWAMLAAKRGAMVTAYEPHPETFANLAANAGPVGVMCLQAAIVPTATGSGTVPLYLDAEHDTRHSLLGFEQRLGTAMTSSVDVPAMPFSEVILLRPGK